MCIDCGRFNLMKREQVADLTGTCAFVSGIRAKIGFNVALKLLRCGARVAGISRYIRLTLANYEKEPDYETWKDRLEILRCDFLNIAEVNNMLVELKKYPINIIINNAAQTFRHNAQYMKDIAMLEASNDNLLIEYNKIDNTSLVKYGDKEISLDQYGDVVEHIDPAKISWNATFRQRCGREN